MQLDGRDGKRVGGRLSADGRWLAYYSRDSGTFEVYVTPFPAGGTRWHIADGTEPTWGPDGRTLVMVRPAGSTQAREVTMIVNWLTEVRRLVGTP